MGDNSSQRESSGSVVGRRQYMEVIGASGLGLLAGCASGENSDGGGGSSSTGTVVSSASSGDEPVVFGIQAPFTGQPKSALQEQNGAKLARDSIGEVNGRRIEFTYRDTALKPSRAARNARELIDEGVDFLAGGISSSVEKAIAEVAGKNEMIYMGSDTGSDKLTGEFNKNYYPYFFRPHPSAGMVSKSLAEYVVTETDVPKNPKTAGLNPNYTWGKSTMAAFESKMNEISNPDYVNRIFPSLGTRQWGPFISRLKSADPDIIFTSTWGSDLTTFLEQAKSAGLIEDTKIASTSYGMGIANQLQEDAIGGVFNNGQGYWYSLDNKINNEFREEYLKRFGKIPPARAGGNYTAIQIIAEAANRAGTVDETDEIIATLETETFQTVYGDTSFRRLDHQAINNVPVGRLEKSEAPKWLTMKNKNIVDGNELIRSIDDMKEILCETDNKRLQQACQSA